MHTPDSDGGASTPEESSSHPNNSSAALAPAALTPPQPLSAVEIAIHFNVLVQSLTNMRTLIETELRDMATRCAGADADTFINGCIALSKQSQALNSKLVDIQMAIRFGGTIK